MRTAFITGANRGMGLEFVRQYASEGWNVIATCRSLELASELASILPRVTVFELELTNINAVLSLSRRLENETIDVFIANAGLLLGKGLQPAAIDSEIWIRSFAINTIAPVICADAFVRQVARSNERKMLAMSSFVGSIGSNTEGGHYPYRASKTALNAVWRSFSIDHPEVIAAMLSPGRVRTEMTGFDAPQSVEEAVRKMRAIIAKLTDADTGRFIHHTGETLPW